MAAGLVFAMAAAAPATGTAGVRIAPGEPDPLTGDDRVILSIVGTSWAAEILAPGQASRTLNLPRAALQSLARMNPRAERLVVDDRAPLLRLQSLDDAAACALTAPECDPLPRAALPDLERARGQAAGGAAVLLDPALLMRALEMLRKVGATPQQPFEMISLAGHPFLGAGFLFVGSGIRASAWVCKCGVNGGEQV